jgi:Flp pilus assembly protein TadD
LAGFDEALRLAPSDPYALKWKGATLLFAGRLEEGRAVLEAAARLDPDDPQTRAWLTRYRNGGGSDDPVRRAW